MSSVHQVWPNASYKALEEDKADRKKGWENNIKERTGLEFAKSQRAVENREKWRKLAVKSSVVPKRPSWLRDR